MGNFTLGFKALFRIWSDDVFAQKISALIEGNESQQAAPAPQIPTAPAPQITPSVSVAPTPRKKEQARSEALTLLSVLQRESRLVDFLKENIASYSDEQIGAAVRGVHKDASAVIARMFEIEPLRAETEGASVDVPEGFDPAQFRLVGNIPERAPFRGKLTHAGWRATKSEVPEWTGREESALVIAPAEVELS